MFTPEERDRVRERVIERARADRHIVSAAAVGSSATGGDRWSDLDLTFAVAPTSTVQETLANWSSWMVDTFGAAILFDVPVQSTIYRVFLLPGALQVDLSFSPASEFGPRTPRFTLIFGSSIERPFNAPPRPAHLFGMSVHHVVRAHICLERGLPFQAEHWIHEARDEILTLACHRRGLDVAHARGFDRLPSDVKALYAETMPVSLELTELRRALKQTIQALVEEMIEFPAMAGTIRPMLAELCEQAEI